MTKDEILARKAKTEPVPAASLGWEAAEKAKAEREAREDEKAEEDFGVKPGDPLPERKKKHK